MVSYGNSEEVVQVFQKALSAIYHSTVKQNRRTFPLDLYKGGLQKEFEAWTWMDLPKVSQNQSPESSQSPTSIPQSLCMETISGHWWKSPKPDCKLQVGCAFSRQAILQSLSIF